MSRAADLSRLVSHALRHEPWLYELELDQAGWTTVDALVGALRHEPGWAELDAADVAAMVASASKQRHEIDGGRIRARYGHSVPGRIAAEPSSPPALLFHGTAPATAAVVLVEGLKPMTRQYVHLSVDPETARAVGVRKAAEPVILQVAAGSAARDGVAFYLGNDRVWLADAVPARYVTGG